jgi:hypothetical protein
MKDKVFNGEKESKGTVKGINSILFSTSQIQTQIVQNQNGGGYHKNCFVSKVVPHFGLNLIVKKINLY